MQGYQIHGHLKILWKHILLNGRPTCNYHRIKDGENMHNQTPLRIYNQEFVEIILSKGTPCCGHAVNEAGCN